MVKRRDLLLLHMMPVCYSSLSLPPYLQHVTKPQLPNLEKRLQMRFSLSSETLRTHIPSRFPVLFTTFSAFCVLVM